MRLNEITNNSDDEDGEFDAIMYIIDEAASIGIILSKQDVINALKQVDLEPEEVSLNQPVVSGIPMPIGRYVLYKGGSETVIGWVTDDLKLASEYGKVLSRTINYTGQTIESWSVVNDWDGNLQLVPPGQIFRKVYDHGYLLLE